MPAVSVNFEECFQRIRTGVVAASGGAVDSRTQVQLAEILGIRQSSISDAKRRGTLPADWLLTLQRRFGLNPDWIEFGTGGMFVLASDDPKTLVLGSEMETLHAKAYCEARADLLKYMTLEDAKGLIMDMLPDGATVIVRFNQNWTKNATPETARSLEQ